MSWGNKKIAGVTYDLSHLDPFDFSMKPHHSATEEIALRVSFGAHTFTRELSSLDTPDFHIVDGGATRCFCLRRHGLSLNLPQIMRDSFGGKAFFGNAHMRYLLLEKLPGLNAPYAVAFKVEKAKNRSHDASLFVVSAHERPGLPSKLPSIGMGTLVALTVQCKKIVKPKK